MTTVDITESRMRNGVTIQKCKFGRIQKKLPSPFKLVSWDFSGRT